MSRLRTHNLRARRAERRRIAWPIVKVRPRPAVDRTQIERLIERLRQVGSEGVYPVEEPGRGFDITVRPRSKRVPPWLRKARQRLERRGRRVVDAALRAFSTGKVLVVSIDAPGGEVA